MCLESSHPFVKMELTELIMPVPEANVHGITEMFDNLVRGAQDERKSY